MPPTPWPHRAFPIDGPRDKVLCVVPYEIEERRDDQCGDGYSQVRLLTCDCAEDRLQADHPTEVVVREGGATVV
jgi:hypothetical protein